MPANLTPQYKKVEDQFRSATTDEERIELLEEMLRIIPKHKGTEHLQAELKRKLSHLRESHGAKKGALTKAKVNITDFPYGTHTPLPGMAYYEDVPIQLVDMPPITAEFSAPGQAGTYKHADIVGIVIDLAADALEQMQVCLDFLDSKNVLQTIDHAGNTVNKPVLVIGTKSDAAAPGTLDTLKELTDRPFEYIEISTVTALNLDKLVAALFKMLNIIRIYAKPPGKPADMQEPFTLPVGSNVRDLAEHIHRELAEKLKNARAWGTDVYEGQSVHRTHVLHDKDIIELHFE